jgi:hypothetical protein
VHTGDGTSGRCGGSRFDLSWQLQATKYRTQRRLPSSTMLKLPSLALYRSRIQFDLDFRALGIVVSRFLPFSCTIHPTGAFEFARTKISFDPTQYQFHEKLEVVQLIFKFLQRPSPQLFKMPAAKTMLWWQSLAAMAKTGFEKATPSSKLAYRFTSKKPRRLSFLDLPVELRLKIYRFCLVLENAVTLRYGVSINLGACYFVNASSQLLRTCKTLYFEGSQVLYGENVFYAISTDDLSRLLRCAISQNAKDQIKHVTVVHHGVNFSPSVLSMRGFECLHRLQSLWLRMYIKVETKHPEAAGARSDEFICSALDSTPGFRSFVDGEFIRHARKCFPSALIGISGQLKIMYSSRQRSNVCTMSNISYVLVKTYSLLAWVYPYSTSSSPFRGHIRVQSDKLGKGFW